MRFTNIRLTFLPKIQTVKLILFKHKTADYNSEKSSLGYLFFTANYFIIPRDLPTFWKADTAFSKCSCLWAAESWTLIRACPCGTTG